MDEPKPRRCKRKRENQRPRRPKGTKSGGVAVRNGDNSPDLGAN